MQRLVEMEDKGVPQFASGQRVIKRNKPTDDTRRAFMASIVIWVLSGTPITSILGNDQIWLILGVAAQLVICLRQKIVLERAVPIMIVILLYFIWTTAVSAIGIPDQIIGFAGQLSRLLIVLVPLVCLTGMRRGLIEAMRFFCWAALIIFCIRQIILIVGFDIAVIFQPFYDLIGIANDRTILIFNFDIVEEATRNSGPFREPGMFAAAIIITFLLLLSDGTGYTRSEVRRRIGLLGVTLLTTQSTMGLAAVPLLGILSLRYFVQQRAVRLIVAPVLALLVVPLFFLVAAPHLDKVENQVSNLSTKNSAWYNTRFGNAYIDYEAIVERPFSGFGFAEVGRPRNFEVYLNSEDLGLGNGLTGTAVKHGLILTILLYLIFLWRMIRLYRNSLGGLVAWAAFGMVLFSQQLILMPAAFTLLGSYGLARRSRKLGIEPDQQSNPGPLARQLA